MPSTPLRDGLLAEHRELRVLDAVHVGRAVGTRVRAVGGAQLGTGRALDAEEVGSAAAVDERRAGDVVERAGVTEEALRRGRRRVVPAQERADVAGQRVGELPGGDADVLGDVDRRAPAGRGVEVLLAVRPDDGVLAVDGDVDAQARAGEHHLVAGLRQPVRERRLERHHDQRPPRRCRCRRRRSPSSRTPRPGSCPGRPVTCGKVIGASGSGSRPGEGAVVGCALRLVQAQLEGVGAVGVPVGEAVRRRVVQRIAVGQAVELVDRADLREVERRRRAVVQLEPGRGRGEARQRDERGGGDGRSGQGGETLPRGSASHQDFSSERCRGGDVGEDAGDSAAARAAGRTGSCSGGPAGAGRSQRFADARRVPGAPVPWPVPATVSRLAGCGQCLSVSLGRPLGCPLAIQRNLLLSRAINPRSLSISQSYDQSRVAKVTPDRPPSARGPTLRVPARIPRAWEVDRARTRNEGRYSAAGLHRAGRPRSFPSRGCGRARLGPRALGRQPGRHPRPRPRLRGRRRRPLPRRVDRASSCRRSRPSPTTARPCSPRASRTSCARGACSPSRRCSAASRPMWRR